MKTNMQRNLMCAFTGMLSLAVVGTLTTSANAQGKMKKPKSGGMMQSDNMQGKMMDKSASAEERRMMMLGEKFGDYKYIDPAPMNYPMAAPATLDLYHFDSYTGDRIMAGSVVDHHMDKMMETDKKAMEADKMNHRITRGAYHDDPFTADPAPMNYPMAAPATLDLYTYTDYTMNKMTSANFMNMKTDRTMMKDNMTPGSHGYSRQAYYDDPFTADPAPVNYPFAAPASLDLYHFSDYSMDKLGTGSASDKKMEKQMMKDNMTPGSRKMGTPKSSGKMKK